MLGDSTTTKLKLTNVLNIVCGSAEQPLVGSRKHYDDHYSRALLLKSSRCQATPVPLVTLFDPEKLSVCLMLVALTAKAEVQEDCRHGHDIDTYRMQATQNFDPVMMCLSPNRLTILRLYDPMRISRPRAESPKAEPETSNLKSKSQVPKLTTAIKLHTQNPQLHSRPGNPSKQS